MTDGINATAMSFDDSARSNDFAKMREFINKLNEQNSTLYKVDVLSQYSEDEFIRMLLVYVYSPFVQFYVTSKNIDKHRELCDKTNIDNLFMLLDLLNIRGVTGNAAISRVNGYISKYEEYRDIVYSIIDKNLKTRIDASLINKAMPDLIPTFNVQLANKHSDYVKKKTIDYSHRDYLASQKLDGCRCLTIIDLDGNVRCYSRSGKEFFTLDTLIREIKTIGLVDMVLDGEVCMVDEYGIESFSDIMHEIKKKDHTIQNPRYYLFDFVPFNDFKKGIGTEIFSERLQNMSDAISFEKLKHVKMLQQQIIEYDEQLKSMMMQAVSMEWEGLILRRDVPYEGKRSNNMLKVKEMHDAEYRVVGTETGPFRMIVYADDDGNETGSYEKTITTMTNVVIEHRGNRVSVGSGFTIAQRKRYFERPELIVGKMITVRYFSESFDSNGKASLRFPVCKFVFEDEDRDT